MKKQIITEIAQLAFLRLIQVVVLVQYKTKNLFQSHRIQYVLTTLFVLVFVAYLIAPTIGSGGG